MVSYHLSKDEVEDLVTYMNDPDRRAFHFIKISNSATFDLENIESYLITEQYQGGMCLTLYMKKGQTKQLVLPADSNYEELHKKLDNRLCKIKKDKHNPFLRLKNIF